MNTTELISNFEYEHGNPNCDRTLIDNGDTITIILEGIAEKEFPKPYDFDEYLQSL